MKWFDKPAQLTSALILAAPGVLLAPPTNAQSSQGPPVQLESRPTSSTIVIVEQSRSDWPQRSSLTISRAADLLGRPLEPLLSQSDGGSTAALRSTLPIPGARLTSGVGVRLHPISGKWHYHRGVDLAAPTGTAVRIVAAGTVTRAGWAGGYGNLVAIDHGGGLETRYGHLSRIDVRVGDRIGAGHQVGLVGSTGNSTGPHLHYEVLEGGQPIDPTKGED